MIVPPNSDNNQEIIIWRELVTDLLNELNDIVNAPPPPASAPPPEDPNS